MLLYPKIIKLVIHIKDYKNFIFQVHINSYKYIFINITTFFSIK